MKKNLPLLVVLLSVFFVHGAGYSQAAPAHQAIVNMYPKDQSVFVHPKSVLIFRINQALNEQTMDRFIVKLTGTRSGNISMTKKITKDGNTFIVKPSKSFVPGEKVFVEVHEGALLKPVLLSYSFTVSPNSHPLLSNRAMLEQSKDEMDLDKPANSTTPRHLQSDPNLPEDFPQYYVSEKNNPGAGHYFVNALARDTGASEYNLIIDTTGFPVFYQHFPPHHRENFFTYHDQVELITYYDESLYKFVALNNNLEKVGTYAAINYFTDMHELILDDDGSYWLLGNDTHTIDMSQIYPGGCTSAVVTGTIIQKIDADSNLVFEWSSWDHFSILDADTDFMDLTKCQFDYSHGNALSFDSLGNILLSSRNMSEITKIDAQTGDIIWRMGGYHNQFTFTNDTVPFKAQHNIQYLGNKLYSMFDNGNSRIPPFSRAITYQLDEVNMTATLTNDLRQNNPPDFTPFMGSNQLLGNGSRLVGWAFNLQKYSLTQFGANGDIEFEIKPVDTFDLISYRAGKYVWETSLFNFDTDTLDFGTNVMIGDSAFASVCLVNPSDKPVEINGYYCTDSSVSLATSLPLTLEANSCDSLTVCFKPSTIDPISAVLSVYHQTDSIRIASQTRVLGGGLIDNIIGHKGSPKRLQIAPNPCSDQCIVSFKEGDAITQVKIFSLDGKLVYNLNVNHKVTVRLSSLNRGAYLIKLFSNQFYSTGKLIVR